MNKNEIPAIREATGAFIKSILKAMLPAIRIAAHQKGYAIAVHGSLKRDIDLVAIPWAHPNVTATPEVLVDAVCGAVAGVLGACTKLGEVGKKEHGRIAWTLVHRGFAGEIDFSVMPPHPPAEETG